MVVTAGSSAKCDLAISDGRIGQIGGSPRGSRVIDARGALVLPGGLDMHVHLSLPSVPPPGVPAWVDDFASGSAAAIAGGITTIGNMTFPADGQSLRRAVSRDLAAAEAATVDTCCIRCWPAWRPMPLPSCRAWPLPGTPASSCS